MAQQTAVNWLLTSMHRVDKMDWDILFMRAVEMEKEQMLEIWMQFFQDSYHTKPEFIRLFDKYYNETYGSNN